MPHKIYMCCDSNNCTCGRGDKLYGRDRTESIPVEETKLKDLTLEQIEYYVKTQKTKKTQERIGELEAEIARLKREL